MRRRVPETPRVEGDPAAGNEATFKGPFDAFKSRVNRLSPLRSLFNFLNKRRLLTHDELCGATVIELQAGDAPISVIAQEHKAIVYTVDKSASACASIQSHGNVKEENIICADVVKFFDRIIQEREITPNIITLTSYQPAGHFKLINLIRLITLKAQGVKLLITCPAELQGKEEFYETLSAIQKGDISGEILYGEECRASLEGGAFSEAEDTLWLFNYDFNQLINNHNQHPVINTRC